jgi:predicted enzyme related to lactoylglutathione lyase
MHLFRVIAPVSDIDQAARFYAHLLGTPGVRVSEGRHYFDCGGAILACFDSQAEDDRPSTPNPEHIYFAVDDLESVFERAKTAGCKKLDDQIKTRPWLERSFYATDPFGNRICFVDAKTKFTATPEQIEEMNRRFASGDFGPH